MTKIAIAEDSTLIRTWFRPWVDNLDNCKVILEAVHGRDLMDKLEPTNLPDVLFLDINMPVMDGFATAKWLAANYPQIKVVVFTSLDSDSAALSSTYKNGRLEGSLKKKIARK